MYWIALQPQPDAAAPASNPLTALGWWALQYTPRVALLADAVLLEVSGSERLWGGRAALLRHVYTSNKPVALIKYAQGTTSLVAYGRLLTGQSVRKAPDDLPLTVLLAAQAHLETLARMGCTTWGQLRALPRGGVARRFGASLLGALDQAYGSTPDLYPWLVLPEVFAATLELGAHVESAPALLFGARRLLAQLDVWLAWHQRGVLAIELGWQMDARRNTASQGALLIRTATVTQDMAHLQRLLGEHLAKVTLPAPVQCLCLRSIETAAWRGSSASLLPDEQPSGDSLAQLIERLSARLGPQNVQQLQPGFDHRPEHMQTWVLASNAIKFVAINASHTRARSLKSINSSKTAPTLSSAWASALYPTWLLTEPLKLTLHRQCPQYHGPLTLLAGPQRLETGWWAAPSEPASLAGQGAALRDYFVARSANSALLWIYRERLSSGKANKANGAAAGKSSRNHEDAPTAAQWYLHGLFA